MTEAERLVRDIVGVEGEQVQERRLSIAQTYLDTWKNEVERLRVRQQELLATIVRLTNETPFPEELQGWESQRAAMLVEIGTLRSALRVAEAVRDDARAASQHDLDRRRTAWADGVRACIDTVKQRHEHYELYRCDCLDRDPGNGHRPGCKGEMMATHPATFAILDEIHTFLQALLTRGQP